jgi:hypothetical protein
MGLLVWFKAVLFVNWHLRRVCCLYLQYYYCVVTDWVCNRQLFADW